MWRDQKLVMTFVLGAALAAAACSSDGASEGDAEVAPSDVEAGGETAVDTAGDPDATSEEDTLPSWCPTDGSPAWNCPCVPEVDETCCARIAEAWTCDDPFGRGAVWNQIFDCICHDTFFCPPEYEQEELPYCGNYWDHWQ